jgi:methylated-DNA-[protein]-cysteine S-methyltransferase
MANTVYVFRTQLGWMGVVATGATVCQLTFGHATAATAKAALDPRLTSAAVRGSNNSPLVRRLQAYAAGSPDDFSDLRIDAGPVSDFRRRVLKECQRVGYGATISYGDLAARAGFPGAARAVGNCMASNRIPLVVPCHRVVCSDGRLGAYSAPGGVKTKRRLLDMESSGADFTTGS